MASYSSALPEQQYITLVYPHPSKPWANGRENYCSYFLCRSYFLLKRVPDDRNFLSEVARQSGMEEAGDLQGTSLTTRGLGFGKKAIYYLTDWSGDNFLLLTSASTELSTYQNVFLRAWMEQKHIKEIYSLHKTLLQYIACHASANSLQQRMALLALEWIGFKRKQRHRKNHVIEDQPVGPVHKWNTNIELVCR